jgi:uncharacterized protein (TIGR00106 family)
MLAELRITPLAPEADFARHVATVVEVLATTRLHYQVHAMGTTLEGELEEILDLVRRCHGGLRKHASRVLIELSIDDRAGKEGELVRSMERLREVAHGAPLERLIEHRAS